MWLRKSRSKDKQKRQASDLMSDVQVLDSPGTQETEESSDVEFADSAYPDSELVPDMLSKRAHRLLDEKVLRRYPWIDDDEKDDQSIYSRITLFRSLARDFDQLDPRLTYRSESWITRRRFEDNWHPWLISVLNECWRKGSFRTIRLLSEYIWDTRDPLIDLPMFTGLFLHPEILQRPDVPQWELQEPELQGVSESISVSDSQAGVSLTRFIVSELSWDRKFEGPAAHVLLWTISLCLTKTLSGSTSSSCANSVALLEASGTGKSRIVDELSKRVVTVPMCLRGHDTNGSAI